MQLCKYKNIFGREGEGVHSVRLGGVAILDVLGTVLVCWWISYYFNISIFKTLLCGFLLGVIMHRLFCVNTTVNKAIFGVV